jgi:hypothetical protein
LNWQHGNSGSQIKVCAVKMVRAGLQLTAAINRLYMVPAASQVCNMVEYGIYSLCCASTLQVQSYHISTMTVSERNALARGWLGAAAELGTRPIDKQSPKPLHDAQGAAEDDDNNSGSHSSDNEQRDVLETVRAACGPAVDTTDCLHTSPTSCHWWCPLQNAAKSKPFNSAAARHRLCVCCAAAVSSAVDDHGVL